MKNFLSRAGFTMIELLVVISVLGILATAVLSAINPIEQINKGRDTGHRSDAEQLINAVDRYYALHEIYPWNDHLINPLITDNLDQHADTIFPGTSTTGGDSSDPNCVAVTGPGAVAGATFCQIPSAADETPLDTACNITKSAWLCGLVTTAEVKLGFVSRLATAKTGNELYVHKNGADSNATIYVCFLPQSQGFKKEAVTACATNCVGGVENLPTGVCPGTCDGSGYTPATGATKEKEMLCLP